jgi:hypothetical protein
MIIFQGPCWDWLAWPPAQSDPCHIAHTSLRDSIASVWEGWPISQGAMGGLWKTIAQQRFSACLLPFFDFWLFSFWQLYSRTCP